MKPLDYLLMAFVGVVSPEAADPALKCLFISAGLQLWLEAQVPEARFLPPRAEATTTKVKAGLGISTLNSLARRTGLADKFKGMLEERGLVAISGHSTSRFKVEPAVAKEAARFDCGCAPVRLGDHKDSDRGPMPQTIEVFNKAGARPLAVGASNFRPRYWATNSNHSARKYRG
jgi:hypothetical protein